MFFRKPIKHFRSPLFTMPQYENRRTLSFCITHKNRFHQLSATLEQNLQDNLADRDRVEFVLVDFGSSDDISGWLLDHFGQYMEDGYFRFFSAQAFDQWYASIAKNTAHMLGRGSILVNLDCDNYTGPRGGARVIDHFLSSEEDICVWQFSGDLTDGTYGRIAVARDTFFRLGGYDEDFQPLYYEDGDILCRIRAYGIPVIKDDAPEFNRAIPNELEDHTDISGRESNILNQKRSRDNIKKGQLVANTGGFTPRKIQELLYNKRIFDEYPMPVPVRQHKNL